MSSQWKPWIGLAAYAVVTAIYFVFPLGSRFGEVLLGTSQFPHDAVLNAGILEWVHRALGSPSLHVFDWTGGFPMKNTLANTENLLGWQPLYALLRWEGFTVPFAYNVLLLISFPLSAAGASMVARRLGAGQEGAFLSGFIFAFLPFHWNHMIHLQTMSICWVPWALYFLDRFLDQGKAIDLGGLAGSFALCVLSGLYIGFFLAITLPLFAIASLAMGRFPLHRGRLAWLVVAGVGTSAALWTVLAHYAAYSRAVGYSHPVDVLSRFSVELLAFIKVPAGQALWSRSGYAGLSFSWSAAFPGFIALALFLYALPRGQGLRNRQSTWLLLGLSAAFFALSLGPRLLFRQNTPVPFANWIPLPGRIFELFPAIRWPMRALLFSFLFGSVIAGLGFTAAARNWSSRRREAACVILAVLLFLEYRPATRYVRESITLPEPLALSKSYRFLATEEDRGGVVELPAADATGYRTPMLVKSVYGSAGHLRRVVAFHGQGWPPLTTSLLEAAEKLPDASARDSLRRYGCSRVIIHRTWLPDNTQDGKIAELQRAGFPVMWESEEAVVFSLAAP